MRLVLVGGGHSHCIVLKKLGMKRNSFSSITLISPRSLTPYSGMIPGLISGQYSEKECHIDLRHLSNYSGAVFTQDAVMGIDTINRYISLKERPPVKYDVLSLDIGSVPGTSFNSNYKCVAKIKPIHEFLDKLTQFELYIQNLKNTIIPKILIIGGGAGGVEISFALKEKLHKNSMKAEITILQKDSEILEKYPKRARELVCDTLKRKNISVITGQKITSLICPNPNEYSVTAISEAQIKYEANFIIVATGASPHPWVEYTPLQKDSNGFILINSFLQSKSHPGIFAAGDIASFSEIKLEKSGVYAVRQGKILYENLMRVLENKPLLEFEPQKNFLSLISTGDKRAIAKRKFLNIGPYNWLWELKDRIDRKFMDSFNHLPYLKMQESPSMSGDSKIKCSGCGSKVGSDVLQRALSRINALKPPEFPLGEPLFHKISRLFQDQFGGHNKTKILIGTEEGDDSAIVHYPQGKYAIQTLDVFKPIISDHYLAGIISANHCLNDIYAMGGIPETAMAIVTVPSKSESETEEMIVQLLSGALKIFQNENCKLIGGHTNEGRELQLGFSVTGLVESGQELRKENIKEEDILILTKPLGTGLIFALNMRNLAGSDMIEAGIESMTLSNLKAFEILKQHKVRAITDISGFGLAGHLTQLLKLSSLSAEINMSSLPLLNGVVSILKEVPLIKSSLYPSNWSAFEPQIQRKNGNTHLNFPMLFDPQTSGGLLGVIPPEYANQCLRILKEKNYHANIIGKIKRKSNTKLIEVY